jgi:hypothetical protein
MIVMHIVNYGITKIASIRLAGIREPGVSILGVRHATLLSMVLTLTHLRLGIFD